MKDHAYILLKIQRTKTASSQVISKKNYYYIFIKTCQDPSELFVLTWEPSTGSQQDFSSYSGIRGTDVRVGSFVTSWQSSCNLLVESVMSRIRTEFPGSLEEKTDLLANFVLLDCWCNLPRVRANAFHVKLEGHFYVFSDLQSADGLNKGRLTIFSLKSGGSESQGRPVRSFLVNEMCWTKCQLHFSVWYRYHIKALLRSIDIHVPNQCQVRNVSYRTGGLQ